MILKNGNVVTPNGVIQTDVAVSDGVITKIGDTDENGIDCNGLTVMPGFIDTHIHGAFGVNFASADKSFEECLIKEAKAGITSVCCTLSCMPFDAMCKAVENIVKEKRKNDRGASIEGIHLEGPFISKEYSGSMNLSYVYSPSAERIKKLYDISEGLLRMITIAPETENAIEAIAYVTSLGIKVSIGHTGADYDTAKKAYEAGASQMTHTFNASVPFHHRSPGVLGLALTEPNIKCEAICDLVHLDKTAVKLIFMIKNENKINIISDSGMFSGLGDGEYEVYGVKRFVKDGICISENGRIAGSCYTMHQGIKNLLNLGYDVERVSKAASLNPAETLGISSLTGTLEAEKRADICVLDKNGNVVFAVTKGVIYE